MGAREIAEKLGRAERRGHDWRCNCPLHNGHSLTLRDSPEGKLLVKCFGGCDSKDILAELRRRNLDFPPGRESPRAKSRIIARYDYADEQGAVLFQVCRTSAKEFPQRRPDGKGGWMWGLGNTRKVLYHLPDLLAAKRNGHAPCVYIAEGEKDVDRLRQWGLIATCNPCGAGKWRSEFNQSLAGFDVVILPDNDEPGRKHAQDVARNLMRIAASVRIVGLRGANDISDWIDAGGTQSDLETLIELTEPFEQASAIDTGIPVSVISAADLVGREFKEPKWAVPEMIAEGLTILAGKPKTGKSWAALDFAVAVGGGYQALGNIACEQGDVLLLALEDNQRRLHQRLKAVLQGQPAPAALQIATQWRRADAGGLDDLRTWLTAHPRARLVVIDTLQMIRGERDKSKGVYADDYQAISALKAIADESGVALLAVHHLRKEAAGDPLESVSGTSGLTGSADRILVLKREPKDTFALLYVRGRDVPEAEIALQFDEATGKWLRLIGAEDFRRSKERRAILRALLDLGEPMTPAEIAEAIGKPRASNANVRMLLKKMREAKDVVRHADGRYTASTYEA
jgi:hypothetical protein